MGWKTEKERDRSQARRRRRVVVGCSDGCIGVAPGLVFNFRWERLSRSEKRERSVKAELRQGFGGGGEGEARGNKANSLWVWKWRFEGKEDFLLELYLILSYLDMLFLLVIWSQVDCVAPVSWCEAQHPQHSTLDHSRIQTGIPPTPELVGGAEMCLDN